MHDHGLGLRTLHLLLHFGINDDQCKLYTRYIHICHFPIAHVIAGVQSVVLVWTQPIVESTHAFP